MSEPYCSLPRLLVYMSATSTYEQVPTVNACCLFVLGCCRYERKPPCSFKNIIDTQIVGAMGLPGGGRNPVSARVLRHFNILSFTELSDDSVGRIFTTILGAFLQRNFGADISALSDKVRGQRTHKDL